MNSGPEVASLSSIRVLVVGTPAWTESVASSLEFGDVSVEGPVSDLDDSDLTDVNCLLTDDHSLFPNGNVQCPTVVAIDGGDTDQAERLLESGATDVIRGDEAQNAELLEHRIRQAIDSSAASSPSVDRNRLCRELLAYTREPVLVLNRERRQIFVSPAIERFTGTGPEACRGETVDDVIHPADVSDFVGAFEDIRAGGPETTTTCEYRFCHADGSWHVHEAVLTNKFEDETIGGVVVSIRDVTENTKIEQELRESFERVTDAFFALDSSNRFSYVNDRAEEFFQCNRSEIVGRHFLDVFPELANTEFEAQALDVLECQEPRTVEGYIERYQRWIEARFFPSESGLSVYFRDITERVDREQTLLERTERLETLLENVPLIVSVLDDDGKFTFAEGRALKNLGFDSGEVVGESFFETFEEYPEVRADANQALDGNPVHSRRTVGERVLETWYRPVFDEEELDRVITVSVDVTERAQYEETLSTLQEATRHLLSVDSKQEACEYIVDVADDVLDLDTVVFRFDERANELVPAAYASDIEDSVGVPTRFKPNESITWETFVTGEPRWFDDVRDSPVVYNESTNIRSGLYVPFGDHGVLAAVSTEHGQYDEETFELVKLFGATAEAALDRIGRTHRLREREQELKQQNMRLERINRASQLREEIEEHLLRSNTRSEIERGICEQLVEMTECSFAWIGEPDPGGNHIVPRTNAGRGAEYLEEVSVTTVDDSATEPAGRTVRSETPTYIENVASELRNGEWRTAALSRNFQSVYSVPLVYDDFMYGVLTLYGTQFEAFDETIRSMLEELGETIAYAIDTVKRTNPLTESGRTEIELEIEDGSVLNEIAETFDTSVWLEGAIPQSDGSTIVFARTTNVTDPDWTSLEGISDVSTIVDGDDSSTIQLRLDTEFFGSVVETNGGVLREFFTDESGTRATVDVPHSVDVREVISGINRRGFDSRMIARHEKSSETQPVLGASSRNLLLEEFTERQREVVQTAYHGGFFEWPRRTTGEEVASSLDISSPAFHKHVRSTQQKVFSSLFDSEITSEDG
ncbi:PAS domain S-box protein [Halostagnicola sp. A-GB9-2]|uniref:PAS domain S-box protein n=1 Tax=Halostagnicola sp. A-GB9-2 TaxID=3048066 RepID=UPI0024BF668E|nr:PAS domain S-box protein [Halostagnicola sp. A-GB9-2]MDJ1434425.1 PAS domain S-box protein [Halostagnicola sp. A-GB9-2]